MNVIFDLFNVKNKEEYITKIKSGKGLNFPRNSDGKNAFHLLVDSFDSEIFTFTVKIFSEFIDDKDNSEYTPLYYALDNQNFELAELLIANGADVNSSSMFGYTLLHLFVSMSVEVTVFLLDHGADHTMINSLFQTPLAICAGKGDTEMVEFLIDECGIEDDPSAFSEAARHGRDEIITILVICCFDINRQNNEGSPHIFCALLNHKFDTAETMIRYGANLNQRDETGDNILAYVIRNEDKECLSFLVEFHFNFYEKCTSNYLPLSLALALGKHQFVKYLIGAGCDVNTQDNDGDTVFIEEVKRDSDEYLIALIKAGSDVEIKNFDGLSAVDYAVLNDEIDTVKLLIENKINIDGTSAFPFAVLKKNKELIELLLSCGADIDRLDIYDCCGLYYAAVNKDMDTLEYLCSEGANLNNYNSAGLTILHQLVMEDNKEAAVLLLERGASPDIKGENNKCAIEFAVSCKNIKLAKLMRKYSYQPDSYDIPHEEINLMSSRSEHSNSNCCLLI